MREKIQPGRTVGLPPLAKDLFYVGRRYTSQMTDQRVRGRARRKGESLGPWLAAIGEDA